MRPLDDLVRSLAGLIDGAGPIVLFHTDVTRMPIPHGAGTKRQALDVYAEALERSAGGRSVVLPTFNYDFCRGGVYDVQRDPAQVGVLNEHYRLHRADYRTRTPVFNFCGAGRARLTRELHTNPFDEQSSFGELRRCDAAVVFLGAPLASNTFLHHVEELANVGYRYLKPFPGMVRDGDYSSELVLRYRVRPLQAGIVIYDWPRLSADLMDAGILRTATYGAASLLSFRAAALAEYWAGRLGENGKYLLTPASARAVERLAEAVGYPFVHGKLEPAAP